MTKFLTVSVFLFCFSVMSHAQSKTSKWDYQHACYTNNLYGIRWQLPTSVKWESGNELPSGVPCILNVHDKKQKITCQITAQNLGGTGDAWETSPETFTKKMDELLPLDITLCSSEKTYVEGVKALIIKDEMKYLGMTAGYFYTILFFHKGYSISASVMQELSEEKKLIKSGQDIRSAYFDGITLY